MYERMAREAEEEGFTELAKHPQAYFEIHKVNY